MTMRLRQLCAKRRKLRRFKERQFVLTYPPECAYCLRILSWRGSTVDHVVPKSRGGTYQDSNLVLACQNCNSRKRSMPAEDFVDLLAGHSR
jgi:5-methylcytosine-specific restriction endonuclease McrA